jgi:hypothetical protein
MLLLAGLMHSWLSTFLDRDCNVQVVTKESLNERASLRQCIESFTPVSEASKSETEAMYETCRWASLILLEVEMLGIPIYVAAKDVRIPPRIIKRLRMTDLTNLWGRHKGLLFWVAAMCHFATATHGFPLLCSTLFARFSQETAMSDHCSEIAIKPLKRLKLFESICCLPRHANMTFKVSQERSIDMENKRRVPGS